MICKFTFSGEHKWLSSASLFKHLQQQFMYHNSLTSDKSVMRFLLLRQYRIFDAAMLQAEYDFIPHSINCGNDYSIQLRHLKPVEAE